MTPPAVRHGSHEGVRELKNGHNSVNVQNQTHVYMNFFHHKDLGNQLLQLCPKVVKHPVCTLLNYDFNQEQGQFYPLCKTPTDLLTLSQLPDKSIQWYQNNTMGMTYFRRRGYSVRISTVATQVSPRVYSVSQSTFRGIYYKQATAIWFTNISRHAHFIQIREVTESEAKERSPMQNENGSVPDLPLSTCCIPLQTQWPMYTSSKGLSLTRIITTNIRVNGMARWLKGKIGQYTRV